MTNQQILNQINALTIALVNRAQDVDSWMDTRDSIHALVNEHMGATIDHLSKEPEQDPEDIPDITRVRATYYGPEVEWELDEILENYNDENETSYTKEDIQDLWVKWNTLHLEFEDGGYLKEEGDFDWEIDTKEPQDVRGFDSQGNRVYGPDY